MEKSLRKAAGRGRQGERLGCSDTYSEGVLPMRPPGFGITVPFSLKHRMGFFSAVSRLQ